MSKLGSKNLSRVFKTPHRGNIILVSESLVQILRPCSHEILFTAHWKDLIIQEWTMCSTHNFRFAQSKLSSWCWTWVYYLWQVTCGLLAFILLSSLGVAAHSSCSCADTPAGWIIRLPPLLYLQRKCDTTARRHTWIRINQEKTWTQYRL